MVERGRAKLTPQEYFSSEDYEWLLRVSEYDLDDPDGFTFPDAGGCAEVCSEYANNVLRGYYGWFLDELEDDPVSFQRYADEPDYGRCLVLCLRYCVDVHESADAMRRLGFLYQIGRFVPHDAREAARFYKMAEMGGDRQSMVNLGYLYEYGHLGEPDYEASFKQFAKVMALGDFPEAIYKVGDAYARARVVEKDLCTAYKLYKKCYENCGDLIGIKAQAAFRLADLLVDETNGEWDIPYDPVQALHYYQVAETGIRIQLADGASWYVERLSRAMAGQDRARKLMEEMGSDLAASRALVLVRAR